MWKRKNSRVLVLLAFAFVLVSLATPEASASPEIYYVSATPDRIQEGLTTTITLDVSEASENTAYGFMFNVTDPAGVWYTNASSYATSFGETSFSISVVYPNDFSMGAHTDYVGTYSIVVDQTAPLAVSNVASGSFIVGLTDKAAYERTETVQIRSSGWAGSEPCTVNVTVAGSPVPGYPKPINADSLGVLVDSWMIPVDATIGTYTISVLGTSTVKPVLDSQNFGVSAAILDVVVWTDKDFYLTDETVLVSANITYPDGAALTSGTVNVTIECLWIIILEPTTTMTYNATSQAWEYRYTLDIADPSAQPPFNWDIYVWVENDGYGNSGLGSTSVNTMVYVSPGLIYTLADGWYDEFGSIMVDGGTLIISNSTVALYPPFGGAYNITVRNSGTMLVENSTIYSELDQWLFWVVGDSSAYFDFAIIEDLMLAPDPPAFLLAFGSSLYASNSSIYGLLSTVFSSGVTMEDSMIYAVMLMDNCQGGFDNVTMGQLWVQLSSEAMLENSIIYGDTIAMMFSHVTIVNSHMGALGVAYNSTAMVKASIIDYDLYVFDGSYVTAYNLSMGYGLIDWVGVYIEACSRGDFTNVTMVGYGVRIDVYDLSVATFNSLNCTAARYVNIDAWCDVNLTIHNALLNATTDQDGRVNVSVGDKAFLDLLDVSILARSYTFIYVEDWANATLENVNVNLMQPVDYYARYYLEVYAGANVTLTNCHFNATGPFSYRTRGYVYIGDGAYATISNSTFYSGYYGGLEVGYGCYATITNCNFTYGYSGWFGFYEGAWATVTNCNVNGGWGGVWVGGGAWVTMTNMNLNITELGVETGGWLVVETTDITGGVYCYDGAWLEMRNVTIGDYLDVGYGCVVTIEDASIGFGPNEYGYIVLTEGVTLTMKNVNINLTDYSWWDTYGFYAGYGCDITLENVNVTDPYGYGFAIYDGSVIRLINSNLDLNVTQGGRFRAEGGVTVIMENSVIKAFEINIIAVYCYITDSDMYAPITIEGSSDVTMKNCLLNFTLMSGQSYTTLIGCTAVDDILAGMGGSLTIDNTTLMKTLYVVVGPTLTIKDSTVTIEALPGTFWPEVEQSVYWLNAYDSYITLNATVNSLWIYNLHNHFNASTIEPLETVSTHVYILKERWCLSVYVVDDYGLPIPAALVEIRNSTNYLIYSGYTDLDGSVRIYPGNDIYTVTVYANGKTATGSATISDMCAVASFELDITRPVIDSITQDPAIPNYKQNVTITANVSDASGITSVTLWYHNGTVWYSLPMSHLSGDLYSGTIPAQLYGTTVRYYIEAFDNSTNSAISSEYTYTVIDNLMPEASDFTLTPSPPVYYQNVIVSVALTDPNGVEAWLAYTVEGTEYWVELTLIGPNRYTATIPKQPYGTVITYYIWTIDGLGNNGTTTPLTYTVGDDIPPTGEIITPSTGDYLRGTVNVTITGHDIYFNKMELYVNGDIVETWISGGIQTYPLDTTTLTEGSPPIKLIIYDKAGNNATLTITVTVDNTLPSTSIDAPTDGSYLKDTVTMTLTGNDANFERMELYISSELVQTWSTPGTQTYSWNTSGYTDGSYTIVLRVSDKAGNANSTSISLIVDNIEPELSTTSPQSGSCVADSITLHFSAFDSNLLNVTYSINAGAPIDVTGKTSFIIDTTTLSDGVHTIALTATDKAENSFTETLTLVVDNTAPSVSLTSPTEGAELTDTATIQFAATDTNLAKVLLYINNTMYDITGKTSYEWDTTTVGDGSHIIKIVATDEAGNTQETQTTVTTTNVAKATGENYASGRDLGLIIGLVLGLIIGAVVVYVATRRRTTLKARK